MKKIKTLIITDPTSWAEEPEEEAATIARYMEELYGLDLDWTSETAAQILDDVDPDLVILDYGGAAMGYSGGGRRQVDEVVRWAKEHPSRLVLVYTTLTLIMVEDVLDLDELPDNILAWDPQPGKMLGKDRWEHMEKVTLKIKHWYGV